MGTHRRYFLSDVGGGLNQGAAKSDIEDRQMTHLLNWYPYQSILRRRPGLSRVSTAAGAYGETITGGFPFKTGGTRTLVVGGETTIGKLILGNLVVLPHVDGSTYLANLMPWSFKEYKGILYGARIGAGTMQHITNLLIRNCGIEPAVGLVTTVDARAGNLPAGNYQCVVTGYNTKTGTESNPNPASVVLNLGANREIDWSNIPTFANSQVDARRLYRTLVNATDQFFFVAQLNDNVTTTYTDNVTEEEMMTEVSFAHGMPPAACNAIETWQERMWSTDGTYLYMSELGLPECYDVGYETWSITPDDGHDMIGILNFGDRLLVGKTNSVSFLTTIDGVNFRISELTADHGIYSHASLKKTEKVAMWFGGDNFYMTDGSGVRGIGDVKVKRLVASIDPSDYILISAAVDTTLGIYYASIPSLGKVAVYMYRTDAWTIFDYAGGGDAPRTIFPFFDDLGKRMLYCNLATAGPGSVYQFDEHANLDVDQAIRCELITKFFGHEEEAGEVILGDFELSCTPSTDLITVTALADDGYIYVPSLNLAISGNNRLWFRCSLPTNGRTANTVGIELVYDGRDPVDILGFTMQITYTGRRAVV